VKKRIVLIGVVVAFAFLGIVCYKTWLVTFVATKCLSGRAEGRQGIIKSIIIPWRHYQLHLHHWFLAVVVGAVFAATGLYFLPMNMVYGFLSAIMFQGIYCYNDWYKLIKRRSAAANLAQPASLIAAENCQL